ncbi:MAG: phenylalanine--tRNA ligase subunit alpha [Proteobacteria bacterium]|uniref:Phenylalanine--tRNA ligase alpha subunit n=1 Tax=Candidatus Enterousia excrementavium TaxID=2840789 RepID=A0A940DEG1_9PROT|nr:phenylalanine--tRNA ligase subunit alpha [Candidatus Enterousia excrementavium]
MHEQIKNINTLEDLQSLYTATFGKNGTMTAKLKNMKNLDNDARAELNRENTELRELFKTRQAEIENAVMMDALKSQKQDVTLSPLPENRGTLHPLTQSLSDVASILESFGYTMWTGPEVEDDWHNFTALNTPEYHPARDMQDSFFLENGNVLRTQTSAIQIRSMEKIGAPIKMFGIGATYRKEMDATHSPMFHQIEGLYIGKDITMSDLIADVREFLKRFFEMDDVKLRIRPSYFPFTEPSIEIDLMWQNKKWLEIMGSGMVHPNVLRNCNINPDEYQGFAFGFGWDRLAMLKYGLNDIRKFYDGDVRWLKAAGI